MVFSGFFEKKGGEFCSIEYVGKKFSDSCDFREMGNEIYIVSLSLFPAYDLVQAGLIRSVLEQDHVVCYVNNKNVSSLKKECFFSVMVRLKYPGIFR